MVWVKARWLGVGRKERRHSLKGTAALKSCSGVNFLDEEGMGMFVGCGGKASGER